MNRLAVVATLALFAMLLGPARVHADSKELLLFNWSNYTPPELLKRFEAETGIKVSLDVYDSNETMIAKLQAGGTGYDVVLPSGPPLQQMIRDGMLIRIDVNALPNFKNVRAPFDKPPADPGRAYSAPYLWGSTGIAYDMAMVKGGKLDDSWKELFEPRPELVGKIGNRLFGGPFVGTSQWFIVGTFSLNLDLGFGLAESRHLESSTVWGDRSPFGLGPMTIGPRSVIIGLASYPIGLDLESSRFVGGGAGLVGDGVKAEPRRQHQPFLRTADGNVDPPLVVPVIDRAQ